MLGKEEEEKEIPRSGDIGDSQLHAIIPSPNYSMFCLRPQVQGSVILAHGQITHASAQFSLGDFIAETVEY